MNAMGMAASTKSDQASTTEAGSTTSRIPRGSAAAAGRIAGGSMLIGGTTTFASGTATGADAGKGGGVATPPQPPKPTPVVKSGDGRRGSGLDPGRLRKEEEIGPGQTRRETENGSAAGGGGVGSRGQLAEELGLDAQVLRPQGGHLGRDDGRDLFEERRRSRRPSGRCRVVSVMGARAGNVPDFSATTEGSAGSSAGCCGSGRGIRRSALHLGHATTVPALPGATARSWLHR